jgi:hypothetical protein
VIGEFLRKRAVLWREWYRTPVTGNDRLIGAIVGGVGFFWIGVLILCALQAHTTVFATAIWLGACVALGVFFGSAFPKIVRTVCFPFTTFS